MKCGMPTDCPRGQFFPCVKLSLFFKPQLSVVVCSWHRAFYTYFCRDGYLGRRQYQVWWRYHTPVQNAPVIPWYSRLQQNIYRFKAADGTVKIIAIESTTDKTKEITNAQMGTFTLDTSGNYYTLSWCEPAKLCNSRCKYYR